MSTSTPSAQPATHPTGGEMHIRVSAVVVFRPNGEVLAVRKAGTAMFMFPGGKHRDDETPLDTAVRELVEETGLAVVDGDLVHLGAWDTAAANEDGHGLHAEVFALARPLARHEMPEPHAEIEQLVWLDPQAPVAPEGSGIAPLLLEVFPGLAARRPF